MKLDTSRFDGGVELEYNVFASGSLAQDEILTKQSARIVNPNAIFVCTGISGQIIADVGIPAFILRDGDLRALSNVPIWIGNFAMDGGQACPLKGGYIEFPPDSVIQFDVHEVSGAGAVDWTLNFWGFLRFAKGVRPC